MRIKAVLLDLDDTLWPVAPLIQQAESTLYDWMAVHTPGVVQLYSIDQLRAKRNALIKTNPRFEYDLWALRHTLLSHVFAELDEDPKKADHAMAVFAHARNQVTLYDDVLPALSELSQHVVLGSVSNGFADLQAGIQGVNPASTAQLFAGSWLIKNVLPVGFIRARSFSHAVRRLARRCVTAALSINPRFNRAPCSTRLSVST